MEAGSEVLHDSLGTIAMLMCALLIDRICAAAHASQHAANRVAFVLSDTADRPAWQDAARTLVSGYMEPSAGTKHSIAPHWCQDQAARRLDFTWRAATS